MGNNLSSFTADDLQIQLHARKKLINALIELIQNEAEQRAKILIKNELLKLPPSVIEDFNPPWTPQRPSLEHFVTH